MANHNYTYRWLSGNQYYQRIDQVSSSTVVTGSFGLLTVPAIKEGSPNPDYASKLEFGEPVGTPYTRIAHMSIAGIPALSYSARASRQQPYMVNSINGEWMSPYRFSTNTCSHDEFDSAYLKALVNLNDWLARGVGQFEGLTFAAEFPKLVASLGSRTKALLEAQEYYSRKMLRHLRKSWRRYGKLKRPLRNKERIRLQTSLSGYYLEYWFGIFPYLKSMEALADSFDAFQSPYLSVHGYGSRTRKDAETVVPIIRMGTAELSAVTMTRYEARVGLKAFYWAPDLFDLNLRLGLTSADIALAGWEILPFSWAVDYWVPVTGFLNTFKYVKLQPSKAFKTEVTRRTHWIARGQIVAVPDSMLGVATWSLVSKRARDVSTTMVRNVMSSFPTPSPLCLLDMRAWSDGPSLQQQSYIAAVTATMTKRFRRLTKLL